MPGEDTEQPDQSFAIPIRNYQAVVPFFKYLILFKPINLKVHMGLDARKSFFLDSRTTMMPGFIQARLSKIQGFSRTSKRLSYSFSRTSL